MLANLFRDTHEPLFLNEGSFASEQLLEEMETLRPRVDARDTWRLNEDIRLLKAGVQGEKRVAFELKNAHYPLVFIHDLNLELDGAKAQIDFLVLSPYHAFVIECKNLYGNVEIGRDGSFVRTVGQGARKRHEGLYSPATQNVRHIELMKAILNAGNGRLGTALATTLLADHLEHYFRSVIVLANDKTIVRMDDAPEDLRAQIVRHDQLIGYIKHLDQVDRKRIYRAKFDEIKSEAEAWLARSVPVEVDLEDRYALKPEAGLPADGNAGQPVPRTPASTDGASQPTGQPSGQPSQTEASVPRCPLCGSPMQLRTARYGKRKGKQFWGCSTYWTTGCTGIINIGG